MATNTLPTRLQINGLIDTNQDAVSNLEKLARNATSWVSYDTANGKWAVVINKSGASVQSFDDSNIIGGIQVTGKDVTELYNRAEIKYPLRDTADATDTIVLEIPSAERSAYEKDRTLEITYDMVNEPVQAMLLGLVELKQSRVDTIVQFTADYSTINVEAGDIIDITNDHLGYDEKLFRVVSLAEQEDDQGAITIQYQCIEYDADVYDETALTRYVRTDRTDIKSLGIIAAPVAPVVTVLEVDSAPHHNVELTVPNGIVESMELWVSWDNSNWELNKEILPGDNGDEDTLSSGDTLSVRRPYLTISREWATGNVAPTGTYSVYWKARGKNRYGAGPFSSVTTKTWEPKFSAEGTFLSATLVSDTGNSLSYTTGNLSGISQAQLGNTSASTYSTTTGVSIPTKDTGAPADKNVDAYLLIGNSVTLLNEVNTYAGTANMAGYQGSDTSWGGSQYTEVNLPIGYGFKSAQFQTQMAGGFYDYETWDPVANSAITVSGLGYVPTLVNLYHQSGSGDLVLISQQITGVTTPDVTTQVDLDVINSARQDQGYGNITTSQLAGNLTVSLFVSQQVYDPGVINQVTGNTEIYPYNWSSATTIDPIFGVIVFQE